MQEPIKPRIHNGGPKRRPIEERFWQKVRVPYDAAGCWSWAGAHEPSGYGVLWDSDRGNNVKAHRVAYEHIVGAIPPGLHIDHLCRDRGCVNPLHLEPVPCGENLRRGIGFNGRQSSQTQCKYGHPLSGENLLRGKDGHRRCRICERTRKRRGKSI